MIFDSSQLPEIKKYYQEKGFVGVSGLFNKNEFTELESEIENSSFNVSLDKPTFLTNDIVLKSKKLLEFCFKDEIIKISSNLLESVEVEIQHSKYNSKPLDGSGQIDLHQDFPFFPHTNTSLLAMGIHIDGSTIENGCVHYYPEVDELYDHFEGDNFMGKITSSEMNSEPIPFIGPIGVVSFHHCLTPHFSYPTKQMKRRLAIVQLRSSLNKQIGGPLWKCGGINITKKTRKISQMVHNKTITNIRDLWEPKEYFEEN